LISKLAKLFRSLFLEFGARVFGLDETVVTSTVAFAEHTKETESEGDQLFRARVLAYSAAIWSKHGAGVKDFVKFCKRRSLSIFECTPSVVNLYILFLSQEGKSFGCITSVVEALSFVYRFYSMPNYALHSSVSDTKKFAAKICEHSQNKKSAFDSVAIRKLWDSMFSKYGHIDNIPLPVLRTFVLCVFQHSTFCRFSDVEKITLDDLFFDTDYFKIKITSSKTDQAGRGEFVFLPKQNLSFTDPHMLLCLWLEKLDAPPHTRVYLFPPLS